MAKKKVKGKISKLLKRTRGKVKEEKIDPRPDRALAGIIGSLLMATILMGVHGYFDQWPYEAISAYATIMMTIAITITLAWTGFSHREIMKHNQRILEEMQKKYKPILRPLIEHRKTIPVTSFGPEKRHNSLPTHYYTFFIKNVGFGPATNIRVFYWLESENRRRIKNPAKFPEVPPLGPNDKERLETIGLKSDFFVIHFQILCKDISEKEEYYKFHYTCYLKEGETVVSQIDENTFKERTTYTVRREGK